LTIKRQPSDFQVIEHLEAAWQAKVVTEPRAFAVLRLQKEGLATPEAAVQVARTLKCKSGAVAYAGLKDKHAQTTQHFTLRLDQIEAGALPEKLSGPGWQAERLGYCEAPIASDAIAANEFTIVVRGMTKESCRDMDQAADLLRFSPDAMRIVNYFGDQRFGSARHGQGFLAKQLIKGEFEAALKLRIATTARKDRQSQKDVRRAIAAGWGNWKELLKQLPNCPERPCIVRLADSPKDFRGAFAALPYFEQQLCVYAYQSHLWNATARKMVAQLCAPLGPVLAADDEYGELLFPTVAALPPALAHIELPLFAKQTEAVEPWKAAAEAVLAEEGLEMRDLAIPGLRRPFFGEVLRHFSVEACNFSISAPSKDRERGGALLERTLKFKLPRGAYATVLLRALGQ